MIVRTRGPRTILSDSEKPYPRGFNNFAEFLEKELEMPWLKCASCGQLLIAVRQRQKGIILILRHLQYDSVGHFLRTFQSTKVATTAPEGTADAHNVWVNTERQNRYPIRSGLTDLRRRPARPRRRDILLRRLRRKRIATSLPINAGKPALHGEILPVEWMIRPI